jgi:hypothetical protein
MHVRSGQHGSRRKIRYPVRTADGCGVGHRVHPVARILDELHDRRAQSGRGLVHQQFRPRWNRQFQTRGLRHIEYELHLEAAQRLMSRQRLPDVRQFAAAQRPDVSLVVYCDSLRVTNRSQYCIALLAPIHGSSQHPPGIETCYLRQLRG